jgi:outer membrane protein assembly factor BamB
VKSLKSLLITAGLCAAAIIPAPADLRTFETVRGESIEAEVVDATPGEVVLMIKGKAVTQSPAMYSAKDRAYLREWMRRNRGVFDWPSARGLRHDGSTEERLVVDSPRVLWRADAGQGDAAVVIAGARACTAGIRDGQVVILELGVEDGRLLWSKSYPAEPEGGRMVATPSIDLEGGRVYSVGPSGRIDCWEPGDGQNVWAKLLPTSYPDAVLPVGGNWGSPLLLGDRVLMEVGGPAYSMVSLSAGNGAEAWRIGKHQSLGATPIAVEIDHRSVIVSLNAYGLVGRDGDAGTMLWDQVWPGAGRASPVYLGEGRIFVTSEKACALFRIEGNRSERVWTNSALCSGVVSPVYYDGFLYGFNGGALTCISADSGEVRWSQGGIGAGNLIRAADKLLIQTGESGELVIADATPQNYLERSRTKVFDGASETIPVFASGRILCRSSSGAVTCLDGRAK